MGKIDGKRSVAWNMALFVTEVWMDVSSLQSPQLPLSSWGGGQSKNSQEEGVPVSKTECSWMNARKRRGLKNRSEEKERGGGLAEKDWQLVSIAWPQRVCPRVFSTGLKKRVKKEKKTWNVNLFSIVSAWEGENKECICTCIPMRLEQSEV